MAKNKETYDSEFKVQALKLAQEIGGHKAAKELGIPKFPEGSFPKIRPGFSGCVKKSV